MIFFLKDYDMSVLYHPDKANIVSDALIRISMANLSHVDDATKDLAREVHRLDRLGVRLESSPDGGALVYHNSKSSLLVDDVQKKP